MIHNEECVKFFDPEDIAVFFWSSWRGAAQPGTLVAYNGPNPDKIKWEQFPAPPEPVVKIIELGGKEQSIKIESADGSQYECCEAWPSTSKRVEFKKMVLWTNSVLLEARHLYQKFGFSLVEQEAHHSFGQDLVGENWELIL